MAYGRVDETIDQVQLAGLIAKTHMLSPLTTQQAEGSPLHHFVRGLIFSAQLLDILQSLIQNGFHAAWGQLVDDDGNLLSPENDIIVYHGTPRHTWETRSFTYSLIRSRDAVLVIQCRAIVRTVGGDLKDYAKKVKEFCPKIWLIAECCWAKTSERSAQIKKDAQSAGYEKFFFLYDHSRDADVTPNRPGWRELKQAIARCIRPTQRRKHARRGRK
jgi:hypothetical protein